MNNCRWTLLLYVYYCYFFSQMRTLVNSSIENEYIWFLKNERYLGWQKISANKFLSFAFEKYCLYIKHGKYRIYSMSLVVS